MLLVACPCVKLSNCAGPLAGISLLYWIFRGVFRLNLYIHCHSMFNYENCFCFVLGIGTVEDWDPCSEWNDDIAALKDKSIQLKFLREFLAKNKCLGDSSPMILVRSQSAIFSKDEQDRLIVQCTVYTLIGSLWGKETSSPQASSPSCTGRFSSERHF